METSHWVSLAVSKRWVAESNCDLREGRAVTWTRLPTRVEQRTQTCRHGLLCSEPQSTCLQRCQHFTICQLAVWQLPAAEDLPDSHGERVHIRLARVVVLSHCLERHPSNRNQLYNIVYYYQVVRTLVIEKSWSLNVDSTHLSP